MKKNLMMIGAILASCAAMADTEVVDGITWTYKVSDGKASIEDESSYSPAISRSTTGAITIPTNLGGYPVTSIGDWAFHNCSGLTSIPISKDVTSIGDGAFYGCSGLKSVAIPSSVTSIRYMTFYNCSGLTSVTIPEGVTSIGNWAFYNCSGLTSVTIPSSVTYISDKVFYGCSGLANILFKGDMPDFGGNDVFFGTPKSMTITVSKDSIGWDFYEKYSQIPPWGTRSIVVAEDSDEEEKSGGGEVVKTEEIHLTVTNVIVHYVTNSKPSDAVIPDYTAGIVNIIAEVDAGKAVSISPEWTAQYPTFASTFDSDFSKALMMETGKKDGAGNPMLVWQDYVAGTDPTKEDDVFTASITFDKDTGVPVISWSPELKAAEAAKRTYRKFGKVKLTDEWAEIPSGHEADYNFFKVTVEMK